MKKTFRGIGVDTATIFIGDYKKYVEEIIKYKIPGLVQSYKIENGVYNVKVRIRETWEGDVKSVGKIIVTSGKIIIADPSYITKDENWLKYLENCEMTHFKKNGMIIDNMGGDGIYDLEVEFIKKE